MSRIASLNDVPSILAYLRRIGAEPRSLRTAVVKETVGKYWKDLATIRFDPLRKAIRVMPESEIYSPTDAEEKAIIEDMDKYIWPAAQLLGQSYELPSRLQGVDPESIFEFRNREGQLVMLQHRQESQDGDKTYKPWTFFDDGCWHMCEPEGLLPLWGMEHLGNHTVVFVHEGAKAARAMHRLVNPTNDIGQWKLKQHPWGPSLSNAAHLGWIGGALNPGRTDWSQLTRSGVKTVYIVADNDAPGVEAIAKISQHLKGMRVFSVKFNNKFPPSFDMADPWPENQFIERHETTVYIGPLFEECVQPATWALDYVKEGKKQVARLRDEFKRQWGWVREVDLYVNLDRPRLRFPEKIFNRDASAFGHGHQTIATLLGGEESCKYSTIVYRPDHPERVIFHDGSSRVINLYVPPNITAKTGDIGPWIEFMEYLVPDEDERRMLMRWCATLIARPDVRMSYAVLLLSETQGIGKNTLGEKILAPLVGRHNCSFPNEKMVVDSNFTSWMVNKRFVFIGEIYAGRNWKATNELKSRITDRHITVNEKYIREYETENWIHVMACSNATLALKLDLTDRRWLVPSLTETPWSHKKWVWFNDWLEGDGLRIIRNWAEQYGDYVRTGEHSPMTKRKSEIQSESESEAVQLLRKWCEANVDVLISVAEKSLREFLQRNTSDKTLYESSRALRNIIKQMGWDTFEERLKVDGLRQHVIISPAMIERSKTILDSEELRKFIRSNIKLPGNDDARLM